MTNNPRVREALRYLPIATLMYLISRVLFDLMAGQPQFWQSRETFVLLIWNACFAIPFIVFALMVAVQRKKSGN
jgi:hypothetical protein